MEKKCGTWDFACKAKRVWNNHKAVIVSTAVGLGCGLLFKAGGQALKNIGKKVLSKSPSRAGPASKKVADEAAEGPKSAPTKADDAAEASTPTSCKVSSFVPGTRVQMADGTTKPIENLKPGDKVRATDEKTGITTARQVEATIKSTGDKVLVTLTLDTDGPKGDKTATITATDAHPFWVPSLHRWVKATDLTPGTWLSTGPGTEVQLTALTRKPTPATVHNLTVSADHTYYVLAGTTPVLVHNCGGEVSQHADECLCMTGGVPKVRNGKLAGKTHDSGVPFDTYGFPDFSQWRHPSVPDVRIVLTGSRSRDFRLANQAAGLPSTPAGYTWHHHQDEGLMQLIERGIHAATGRTGGF
ncbi:intein [Actinocorallia herbida]|uniref:Intein n=1 Tax=Actinocorallia herbida TaxID=58109 RepID=A0A3N1CT66_9ACTN|nr:polymorphic toxin-type HINT domain-containing protein [Actinocorallia herbida]ROO84499.1 intein [Actinocorallia herbida]